jgi:hypothetical protein
MANPTLTIIDGSNTLVSVAQQYFDLDNCKYKEERIREILYNDLVNLRDSSKLTPGKQYRIIDYVTTTSQEETASAGHKFDIIVTALSRNTISEDAKAIQSHYMSGVIYNSTPTVKFNTRYYNYKPEIYTIYNVGVEYFNNSKLEAWELKYCLDNDTNRFYWADSAGKGVIYYMKDEFGNEAPYDFKNILFKRYKVTGCNYTKPTEKILLPTDMFCDDIYGSNTLDDEFGNDWSKFTTNCSPGRYPFFAHKNNYIFKYDTSMWTYCYTFNNCFTDSQFMFSDASLYERQISQNMNHIYEDEIYGTSYGAYGEYETSCPYNNIIKPYHVLVCYDDDVVYNVLKLNNIVFTKYDNRCSDATGIAYAQDDTNEDTSPETFLGFLYSVHDNVIEEDCYGMTLGNYCYSNTFGQDCRYNTFGQSCYYNTFGQYCYSNTFGQYCYYNTFGQSCYYNTFGQYCYYNTFGQSCYYNTFGQYCYSNTFGQYCYSNTFGQSCYSNTFGQDCRYNTFGQYCYSNTFGQYCYYNTFGQYCYYNTFGQSCHYNTFGQYCYSNTFGKNCIYDWLGFVNHDINSDSTITKYTSWTTVKNNLKEGSNISFCKFDDDICYTGLGNYSNSNNTSTPMYAIRNVTVHTGLSGGYVYIYSTYTNHVFKSGCIQLIPPSSNNFTYRNVYELYANNYSALSSTVYQRLTVTSLWGKKEGEKFTPTQQYIKDSAPDFYYAFV